MLLLEKGPKLLHHWSVERRVVSDDDVGGLDNRAYDFGIDGSASDEIICDAVHFAAFKRDGEGGLTES